VYIDGILCLSLIVFALGSLFQANKAQLIEMLSEDFLPVNLEYPGLRVLSIDPFVATIEGFLSPADCDALIAAAQDSGKMTPSRAAGDKDQTIRTSTSLAVTTDTLQSDPALAAHVSALLSRARTDLLTVDATRWDDHTKGFRPPSAPGRLAFELPQVARYTQGQHFLAHEDAFPLDVASVKGYQRIGTLLVYLNDVGDQGGETCFEYLGPLAVTPKKGQACLFFPSFSSGLNDPRTLHSAMDAVAEKWVSQTWVSCGVAPDQFQGAAAIGTGARSPELSFAKKKKAPKPSGGAGKKKKGGFGG